MKTVLLVQVIFYNLGLDLVSGDWRDFLRFITLIREMNRHLLFHFCLKKSSTQKLNQKQIAKQTLSKQLMKKGTAVFDFLWVLKFLPCKNQLLKN